MDCFYLYKECWFGIGLNPPTQKEMIERFISDYKEGKPEAQGIRKGNKIFKGALKIWGM